MIRAMKEEDLQRAGRGEVVKMVRDYSDWNGVPPAELEKAANVIDRIRKMKPAARRVIATYLRSNELFCHECGETSCIHGYPDD